MTAAMRKPVTRRAAHEDGHADVEQAVHDLATRVGADRRGGEARSEQADREDSADDGPERGGDRGVRALDGVGAALSG